MRKTRGFTLIELLVVVAIIALLIAILLPSLGKARENARITVCGTHMRQIAMSNLMYTDANGGNHIAAATNDGYPTAADKAKFWASDLAVQGYLPTKNNIDPSGSRAVPSAGTIFYCPDGDMTENGIAAAGGNVLHTGGFPRSQINRWYVRQLVTTSQVGDVTAFTWYALNAHNISNQSRLGDTAGTQSGGGGACPFVQFNKDPATLAPIIQYYQRKITMIKNQSKMMMVVESSSISWDANGNTAPTDGDVLPPTPGHPERLAGRHGDALNNGYDGFTNFAFFDGHVAKFSTVPYSQSTSTYSDQNGPQGNSNLAFIQPTISDVYIYLQNER